MACPVGHAGTWYGALNDSYIDIWSDTIAAFSIKSFDASFIGSSPVLGSYPGIPALLRLQGMLADGSYLLCVVGYSAADGRSTDFTLSSAIVTSSDKGGNFKVLAPATVTTLQVETNNPIPLGEPVLKGAVRDAGI